MTFNKKIICGEITKTRSLYESWDLPINITIFRIFIVCFVLHNISLSTRNVSIGQGCSHFFTFVKKSKCPPSSWGITCHYFWLINLLQTVLTIQYAYIVYYLPLNLHRELQIGQPYCCHPYHNTDMTLSASHSNPEVLMILCLENCKERAHNSMVS